jgi:DHA1 family vesicular acetylcholine transporter-like MFS transporter 3
MSDTPKQLIFFILCVLLLSNSILYIIIQPDLNDTNENDDTVEYYQNLTDEENLLISSTAIVKLTVNMFSGVFIDYVGYDISIFIGVVFIFGSSTAFALTKGMFGQSYLFVLIIGCLQGFGSAFADTGSFAMIADEFKENKSRLSKFGSILIVISFGRIIAEPLAEILFEYIKERDSILLIGFVGLLTGIFLISVKRLHLINRQKIKPKLKVTPIWRLLADPYIIVCAGALLISNISLAFLEPTLTTWINNSNITYYNNSYINESKEFYMIWLPGFLATLIGVFLTMWLCRLYSRQVYIIASIGLFLQGLSCFFLFFAKNFVILVASIFGIFFGKAILDTSILPLLSLIVDTRHTPFYGTVYAIANISYSIAYIVGPFIAVRITQLLSFGTLIKIISSITILYLPVIYLIRSFYEINLNENDQQVSLLYDNLTVSTSSLPQYKIYKKKRDTKEVLAYI